MEPLQTTDSSSADDREVYTETVRIESKLFYIDLKENTRGRYLKLSEKRANRPRSTIIVPASGISWFVRLLYYYLDEEGEFTNKELPVENKVFYFGVGENARGRYLRISESGGGPAGKTCVIIPAAGQGDYGGWSAFSEAIKRVFSHHTESAEEEQELPGTFDASQPVLGPGLAPPTITPCADGGYVIRAGQKRFFFDMGSNYRGQYLRITEVVGTERSAIVVPVVALELFQQAIQYCSNPSDSPELT